MEKNCHCNRDVSHILNRISYWGECAFVVAYAAREMRKNQTANLHDAMREGFAHANKHLMPCAVPEPEKTTA